MTDVRVILDFPAADGGSERVRFGAPARVIVARELAEVGAALAAAEQAARRGAWVVGFVAYEAAPAFDRAWRVVSGRTIEPLAWFGVFAEPVRAEPPLDAPAAPQLGWRADTAQVMYDDAIRTIRAAIAAGDVYQVNYTLRLLAECTIDASAWYDALVARRHGRYHALIETRDWALLSLSPELFFDVAGGRITTRPMKGTLRRGRWLEEDRAARAQLAASAKDRAENLMIVDLLRNDLGRIARFGSVSVPHIFSVETYPTVLQLTSTITAELRADVALADIFAATFPCGSITGAPKFTAMRAIARLETAPRGAYCGAIGVLRPDGSATFNVGIRTIVVDRQRQIARYGIGGGITWDSRAGEEYDEAVAKAALLHDDTPAFRLLETMRLQDGIIVRRDRHLQRLRESAEHWDFCAHVVHQAAHALERAALETPHGTWRIRLLAARDGNIELQRSELAPAVDSVHDVALAHTAISRRDPLLYHKTTARALYDSRRADHPVLFEVLLYNEEGQITEFCTGNIVVEIAGERLTPPRDAGLLAGTFRAELLENGSIRERSLTLDDVRHAQRIWLINSVREWVACRLVAGS